MFNNTLKTIIKKPGEGKTEALIFYAEKLGIKNILCAKLSIEHHMCLANELGVKVNFYPYEDLEDIKKEDFLVDDIDLFIKSCYSHCRGFSIRDE